MMKNPVLLLVALFIFGIAGLSGAGEKGTPAIKAGDEIYACGCGEKCPCDTISKKGGKCTCAKEIKKMEKAKVIKVEGDKATIAIDGKERSISAVGKFACACGSDCGCKTISQTAGKCSCGKELKKIN